MSAESTKDQLDDILGDPSAASPGEWALRRRVLAALQAPSAPPKMAYEEFLAWADEDTLAEWVDGEVIMTSAASNRHQDIAGFLESLLRLFVESRQLGVVRSAPFQMKLAHSGREPDLLFIASEHLGRLHETFLDGPADLVVEVISPESIGRDRGDKFAEYEAGGVPEYWLLDPQRRWAECYQLAGSLYRPAFSGAEGQYHSLALPGFWLRVEWLWQSPLPAVDDVLLEIGGAAYARQWIERLRRQGFLPDP